MSVAERPSKFAERDRKRKRQRERDRDGRKKTARNGEFRVRGKKVYRFSAESASDCRKIWKIIATSRCASEIVGVAKKERGCNFHMRHDRCGYKTSTRATTKVCE